MKEQLIYKDLAKYYDLIYESRGKDYEQEVKKIESVIDKYKSSKSKKLLEVACGTGKHLKYFSKHYECTGVDINQGILDIAKRNAPNVKLVQADMAKLDLEEKFDIITCLFSSIGYITSIKDFKRTSTMP